MNRIFCLLGKTGAGKDTLFNSVISDPDIDISPVITCTTRPRRVDEIDGINYRFMTEEEMNRLEAEGGILERRTYSTVNGLWHYFTAVSAIPKNGDSIIITTPAALKMLSAKMCASWTDRIVAVMLETDARVRLLRSIERESREAAPNYAEVCRRFYSDEADFKDFDIKYYNHFIIDANLCNAECLAQFKQNL